MSYDPARCIGRRKYGVEPTYVATGSSWESASRTANLGDVVSSWIGTGQNQPIAASRIQSGLGSDAIKKLAARMGIAPDAMSAKLAELLPGAIDKLTPNGKLPEGGLLAEALSALQTKVS